MGDTRAVVLWKPPPPPPIDDAKVKREAAIQAETDARIATAERKRKQEEMRTVALDLAVLQLRKLLTLSQHPDFANAIGPLSAAETLKLVEFVSKEQRLDAGQATEHVAVAGAVAHAVVTGPDFGKFTQEERNKWRELALKAGAGAVNT